jgi:integrase
LTKRSFDLLLKERREEGIIIGFRDRPIRIIKTAWDTALRKAGVRHLRFHDLRHTFNTRLMEAGVLQEVRMTLMGHSPGSRVHATYTHIELPVKREAIRKLEEWKIHQEQLLNEERKEQPNANSEVDRSESGPSPNARGKAGTQSVEEEDAR